MGGGAALGDDSVLPENAVHHANAPPHHRRPSPLRVAVRLALNHRDPPMPRFPPRVPCAAAFALSVLLGGPARADTVVDILYLQQRVAAPATLSTRVRPPDDEGLRGAELGVADNDTTGRFLGQDYALEAVIATPGESLLERAREALGKGARNVVVDAPADVLVAIAGLAEAADDLLFNARARDRAVRETDCRANLLHTVASRDMLADALMQFLSSRRWSKVFLVEGRREADAAWADALTRSATKFGLDIVEKRDWTANADLRRSASREMPAVTRARRYDVVVVADEARDFAEYLLYNTWLPRPVAGSAGLVPTDWSPVVEQWGAAQLQSRFEDAHSRGMTAYDYAAWAAVRALGEAVTRTASTEPAVLRDYLLSEAFALAAFKGASLGFRDWNGQLRQRIPLVHANAVVANAPLEGFLHERTELDTLGIDRRESVCTAFAE